jgi:hypothetical protein
MSQNFFYEQETVHFQLFHLSGFIESLFKRAGQHLHKYFANSLVISSNDSCLYDRSSAVPKVSLKRREILHSTILSFFFTKAVCEWSFPSFFPHTG